MAEIVAITKLDAARRQLRTAIELWFKDGDPVSIHALAYASHEIIHKLFRKRGLHDLLFDSAQVREEYRKEWAELLKASANFIKHSNRADEVEAIDFNPLSNVMFMAASLVALSRMDEKMNDSELAFILWARVIHPNWFTEDVAAYPIPIDALNEHRRVIKECGREAFLDAFLKIQKSRRMRGEIS